jgi:hydroxylamine dehydrogenase
MAVLKEGGLLTKVQFDEEIEWTWFYLWHHEGRRARHGASMMAPDYAHWHGMFEVAERFYQELIPQAREIAEHAAAEGKAEAAEAVEKVINDILARPEHQWFERGDQPPAGDAARSMPVFDLQQPVQLSHSADGQTREARRSARP